MSSCMWVGSQVGQVDPFRLLSAEIEIEDIARSLSRCCRFGGHTIRPYTVAEHCLLVSRQFDDPEMALWGLLHDAAETYLGDWKRPIKNLVVFQLGWPGFVDGAVPIGSVELLILESVAERFGLMHAKPFALPAEVRRADDQALVAEIRDLFESNPRRSYASLPDAPALRERISRATPQMADVEWAFLERFEELRSLRGA